ncbi:MAG: S8 family peptidase [Balneolaceae bacterium]
MKNLSRVFTVCALLFAMGCAGPQELAQNIESAETDTTATAAIFSAEEATNDWHLNSPNASPFYGTSVERAYEEFLADKSPQKKVIVAIIDSGTDIEHEDLTANIWVNNGEVAGNNLDDDENGYVDDVHGWNFIGGPDSAHVDKDTYEITRLYSKLGNQYAGIEENEVPEDQLEEYNYYLEIKEAFENRVQENNQQLMQVSQILQAVGSAKEALNTSSIDSVSMEELVPTEEDTPEVQQAKQILAMIKNNGATEQAIEETQEFYEHLSGLSEYGLNPEFDPRDIVGDDYEDLSNRFYGNNDVNGPSNEHGTHVSGIVGAVRDNNLGTKGIAGNIELMILRTVPDGDERDKDVANAIRYAAENGANVINMSFGKGYSPEKIYVDAAIRFADSTGVLMVSGSGNDGQNVDSTDSYPSRFYDDGGFAENYLSVGASSWESDSTLAAGFSNYGKETVDLFAPGVDVYSTYPNNEYKMNSGTSMASPVVAGVAALIMSYYPDLSTIEVKDIMLSTVTKVDQQVLKPASQEYISFSELSATGGIINAYEALKLAEQRSNQ